MPCEKCELTLVCSKKDMREGVRSAECVIARERKGLLLLLPSS
ncbi:hypothetical protein HanPSC8_Chr16g0711801 [Helianthus annuus]|nr:hypothetical protein HanPSC8_Chr16g0711801 [Helianthus annuus]